MSLCPECGSWDSHVLATRKDTRYNWTWRKRECKDCNNKWRTYELPVDNIEPPEPLNPDGKLRQ